MLYPSKYRRTIEKAVEILRQHKFSDEVDAYWILVKNQEKLELPVIWDIVAEALKKLKEEHESSKEKN